MSTTRLACSTSWTGSTNLLDVNVLIGAFRADLDRHADFERWLTAELNANRPFAVCPQVVASFLRVVTNRRVFKVPSPNALALAFAETLLHHPQARLVTPGSRHWTIFSGFLRLDGITGNLVTDAWFAAIAIEAGCTWVTADRDYAKFPGLDWRNPLD